MSRFNDAAVEISSFDQVVGIAAVIQGLKHERFRDNLIKHLLLPLMKLTIELSKHARILTLVSQHKLSTNPLKKLVAQKRCLFGGERLKVIKEEVEKLLQTGFIRRVDYCEWAANLVLVKKANGKWRMCIDYTNLNQACPKDCYPMPNIDKLVEAASGNERLSLLDAYSGYHQVPMALEDEEKTSFYAGDEIYCYVMMPFGLKNVGATYQKMVTIMFQTHIGRNLEVYVDNLVVKSWKAKDHLANLDETFSNLRNN
ncbi:hypothetical protein SLEP1_g8407 [Rubroshorea leprosula]|uniref:Reverse transcriptase domain-containing protein n=1 Tax=Rubroshorea leprosula TaxID=152421 RepID=A0AAV5ICL8_9ROSI|nr:hypothetical protein SLEP1_g8407 [Rubroshorea leprosula]